MVEYKETVPDTDFKDRKVRLLVFGILQIIFGSICALIVPFMILGVIMSAAVSKGAAEGVSFRMMVPGVLFYLLLAVWFIWMGIGSVKTRRWARALILVSSWLWLITGVLGFVFMLHFLPKMYDRMGESGRIPEGAVIVMKYAMMAFMAVFYVIIPGLLVLFYRGRHVKATCEYRDPHVRWTDKCPLPVLGVSLVCAFWAVSLLFMGAYRWTIPFFGIILSGMPGAIVVLVLILLFAYIAWGAYKLDIKAWWCVLLVNIGWFLSTIITFSCVSMQDFYEKMNFPRQQLEMMKQYDLLWGSTMGLFFSFWIIAVLAYLMYIRKYFVAASNEGASSQVSGRP